LATFRHRPIDEQLGGFRMWSFVHGPNDERRRYESIAWGDEFNLSASALEQDIGWVFPDRRNRVVALRQPIEQLHARVESVRL
jgi:hypothetical protein